MSGKVFGVVIGVVIVIILAISLPAIPDAVQSFRTDTMTQEYTVATGATVTNATISLSHTLWDSSPAYITRLSSNITTDSPVAYSYNSSNKGLLITGLSANTSRTVEVDYRTAGLGDYEGADTASMYLPGVAMGLVILIPLGFMALLFIRH